jgi:hypothetical protein
MARIYSSRLTGKPDTSSLGKPPEAARHTATEQIKMSKAAGMTQSHFALVMSHLLDRFGGLSDKINSFAWIHYNWGCSQCQWTR